MTKSLFIFSFALHLPCVYSNGNDDTPQESSWQTLLGKGRRKNAGTEEPLLKPDETVPVYQIPGVKNDHKVPYQLVLTSKSWGPTLAEGVRNNLLNTLSMDSWLRVRWLIDEECFEYLKAHFKPVYAAIFKQEHRGSFRGDICRAAVLYREGGFYSDLDLELRLPFTHIVDKKTSFMSCVTADSAILNAVIAAAPRNAVMRETLSEIRKWYEDPSRQRADQWTEGTSSEWMGPVTMLRGLRSAMGQECPGYNFDPQRLGSKISCGKQEIQFYQEAELNCWGDNPVECPQSRAMSEFAGARYGIFAMDAPDVSNMFQRTLIGWPRFADCKDWGCNSGGWEVAANDLDVKQ